ncbi:MAG: hypothetical protein ACLFS3_00955 [Candidatus Aenigmatarchaeota archaeon]
MKEKVIGFFRDRMNSLTVALFSGVFLLSFGIFMMGYGVNYVGSRIVITGSAILYISLILLVFFLD